MRVFALTAHAVQQFLIRYPTRNLIDDLAFLRKETETGQEVKDKQELKKYQNGSKREGGRYFKGEKTIFVVRESDIVSIWMQGMKRIPKAPRRKRR